MSIVIDDGIRAIFFLGFSDRADYLCAVRDNPSATGYLLTSRVRIHADDRGDPWDLNDRKLWHEAAINEPLDVVLDQVRDIMKRLTEETTRAGLLTTPPQGFELIRAEGTVEEFAARLQASPFAHSKTLRRH